MHLTHSHVCALFLFKATVGASQAFLSISHPISLICLNTCSSLQSNQYLGTTHIFPARFFERTASVSRPAISSGVLAAHRFSSCGARAPALLLWSSPLLLLI